MRVALAVLSVSIVSVIALTVERRWHHSNEYDAANRSANTNSSTSTGVDGTLNQGVPSTEDAASNPPVDGAREAWWERAVDLRAMPEVWDAPNLVQARADGCYVTETRTAEDAPRGTPSSVTPPSTAPAMENPAGSIERGRDCGRGSMRWRYRTGDVVSSSAAFYNDAAVIGSRDGVLYALNLRDGETRWKSEGHGGIDVIPHVKDDVVYFGTGQGQLVAVHAQTGADVWRVQNDGPGIFQSSPTTYETLLVSGGGGNRLRGFKKSTGEKVWEYRTDLWVQSSAAVRNGVAYIGSDDGWLHAVDAKTGKLRWRFAAALPGTFEEQSSTTVDLKITPDGHRSNVLSTPRFYKNLVFITSVGGVVYGVNADTGEEVWRHVGERSVSDTTVSEDGVVYVHTDAAILRAYEASTGRVLWASRTGTNKNVWSGPYQTASAAVIHGDEVIIGGRDGDITSYDRRTGRYLWSFRTGLWIQSTPKIQGDVLIVGSNDGWVYALNL